MALSLEERIKQLMEGKSESTLSEESIQLSEKETIKTKGGATITDEDEGQDSDEDKSSDDEEDDSEEQDEDQGSDDEDSTDDSDEDTDFEKDAGPDQGKKNSIKVNEDKDPFGKLDANGGDSAGDAGKNAKLKVGLGKKDPASGKLTDTAKSGKSGKSDDNGDNARLKTGLNKKESSGKLTGPAAGITPNPDNARNNVETQKMSEHIDALMNGEELSEEFRNKATTIFEAAVQQVAATRVETMQEEYAQEIVRLQEEQEQQLVEAVEEVKSELVEQIDGFLNHVVEQWVGDNQIALEGGMKVELVNGFIDGLKDLFKEHYVDIPEDRLDLIEEQSEEIGVLTATAEKLAEERSVLEKELVALKSQLVFEDVASDLTSVQKEKFKELVESVEFSDEEAYADKLSTLKESYFPVGKAPMLKDDRKVVLDESTDINQYAAAIANKTLRF
jgi:hypothetical protein